jgi:DNA-directed RNA polymerase specialized sigma24 family protein
LVAETKTMTLEEGTPKWRTANLLTGSQQAAEDLLLAALERLLKHWNEVGENPEGYLRRIMYNLAADGWRAAVRAWPGCGGCGPVRPSRARAGPSWSTCATPWSASCSSCRPGSAR